MSLVAVVVAIFCCGMLANVVGPIFSLALSSMVLIVVFYRLSKNRKSRLFGFIVFVWILGYGVFNHAWCSWSMKIRHMQQTFVLHLVAQQLPKSRNFNTVIRFKINTQQYFFERGDQLDLLFGHQQKRPSFFAAITAVVRCKPFHGHSNGVEPDGLWYGFSHHVLGTCQVLSWQPDKVKDHQTWVIRLRRQLAQHLFSVPNLHYRSMFLALTLGDQNGIKQQLWSWFRSSGTAHLIAVSGLHIGLVAFITGNFFSWLWAQCCCWSWPVHQRYWLGTGRLFGGILYTLLSGVGVSSLRAMMMLLLFQSAEWLGCKPKIFRVLLLTVALLLGWQPAMFLSLGFWLSVIAVAALVSNNCLKLPHCVRNLQWLAAQLRVLVAMLPMQAIMIQPIGFVALIVNMAAIPLFSLVFVPLSLFATMMLPIFNGAQYLLQTLDSMFICYFFVLKNLLHHVHQTRFLPIASWLQWAGIVTLVLLLWNQHTNKKWLVLLLVSFYLLLKPQITKGQFNWSVLDVGQGLAIVIKTKYHTLLVDSGNPGQGRKIVVPFLQQQGIGQLDAICISHPDRDHIGGLSEVLAVFKPQKLWVSEQSLMPMQQQQLLCDRGMVWSWDGVKFEFINELANQQQHNNKSCVLRVTGRWGSILLPGDIEQQAELKLVKELGHSGLQSTILVLPHHGSKTSSTPAFIAAVLPKVAIASAGNYHRFHHPDHTLVARLKSQGIRFYNTYVVGSVSGSMRAKFHIKFSRLLMLK